MKGVSNGGNIYNIISGHIGANMRVLNSQILKLLGLKHVQSYAIIVHAASDETKSDWRNI